MHIKQAAQSVQHQATKSQTAKDWKPSEPQAAEFIRANFAKFDIHRHEDCKALRDKFAKWAMDVYRGNRYSLLAWAANTYEVQDGETIKKVTDGHAYGNGKSLLCKMAFNSLSDILVQPTWPHLPDKSSIFLTAKQFFDGVMWSMGENELRKYLNNFHRATAFIYDDFGTEGIKADSIKWWQGQWYDLFSYAFDNQQPFILTTNLSLPMLQEQLGGKNWDRVDGMVKGNILNFSRIPTQRKAERP